MNRKKLLVGSHVSIQDGFASAVERATTFKANCFAIFTGSQRVWKPTTTVSEQDAAKFKSLCSQSGIDPYRHILTHGSYLLNLGSAEEEKLSKSRALLKHEVSKCVQLGIGLFNFHPGAHLKLISESDCMKRVAESINMQLEAEKSVTLVLENTAGQGTYIGYRFEHMAQIIENVEQKDRIGVCLDTCHAFSAGYDLRTETDCINTFNEFEKVVGFQYLKGMHLNDSKTPFASKKDRHENIGHGTIGKTCFEYIVNDSRFRDIPLILETPNDMDSIEIELLRSMVQHESEQTV